MITYLPSFGERRRGSSRYPGMGHHNNITAVESAHAYAPLPSPATTIGTTISVATTSRRSNNSNSNASSAGNCTGATTTGAVAVAAAMQNGTSEPDRSASDYYYYYAYDNATETALFFPLNGTTGGRPDAPFEKLNCQWIPAQQSLFQFSNICFLTAFIVPRSYKLSVLSLR